MTGITSLTSDAVVTKTSGFRIIDSTDTTKQVAFDVSAIGSGVTRTLTIQNKNGTLITKEHNPNFESGLTVAGNIQCNGSTLTFTNNSGGTVKFMDSNNNPDFQIFSSQGKWQVDQNDSADPIIKINTDKHVDINYNLDLAAGLDVTGNITVSGTVDGKDIATLTTEDFATAIAVALG